MYAKSDGQLKCIEKFDLKSSSATIYIHTKDEEWNLEVYKCPPKWINYKRIRRPFATDFFIPGDLECGNEELIMRLHQLEISISQSHTNTPLNRNNFNCNWNSINLGECKITNTFWLPDRSPFLVRINPAEKLPTVVGISIPARTAEFANIFLTLKIAGRNFATPTLDTTKNQRLVDLLAFMIPNLGTYTGVSLINLLQETCNF